ncbi:MAG TPA: BadF/BadG/BcrA/BcrD ATPase family protein [Candidatus Dormibacteraeota bacterium]|nr:BadF/BadG/BcrA/BcrD ATPase family protein [Candidatus Dormibacteraeota bacterium]
MSIDHRVVAESEGAGANIATIKDQVVERRLDSLLREMVASRPAACCAGAAGAEIPARRARLRDLLEKRLPGCRVEVVHDARLVLAAAGLDAGIVLIAGTGSVAYGRSSDAAEAQAGGWGWMLGDEGSGAWIAREAAREVLRRADDGAAPGPLSDALFAATRAGDSRELMFRMHAMREAMRWAALASTVFDTAAVDDGASAIVARAAAALCALVTSVEAAIGMTAPVVLAGGLLLHQPLLEQHVRDGLRRECIRLEEAPVAGAVRLAERLIGA